MKKIKGEKKAKLEDKPFNGDVKDAYDSGLPPSILSAYKVLNADGTFADSIVLRHRTKSGKAIYSQLNFTAMTRGNSDELSRLCFEHSLVESVGPKSMRQIAQQILGAATDSVRVVTVDGFHRIVDQGINYEFFLWRGRLHWLGESPKNPIIVDSKIATLPAATCTVDKWNDRIGIHIAGNPYLLVTLCSALSSLIGRWLGLPSTILWIVGASSTGKSSGQKAIISMAEAGETLLSATGSAKGLRAKCATFADRPAFFEEARQTGSAQALMDLVFDVANHATRLVSTSDQKVSEAPDLSCGLVVSNERTLEELVSGKKVPFDEGLYARLFELAVDGPHGFFHELPGEMSAAQFSVELVRLSNKYYGAIWDEWVPAVAKNAERIKNWESEKMQEIYYAITKNVEISDPVTARLLRGVAAWAFAGYVASKLKIVPITKRHIIKAFQLVVREYVGRVKEKSTPIGDQIIECVRDFIDSNAGKFPDLSSAINQDQSGIYGFRRQVEDETQFLFFPAAFKKIVGAKFGTRAALLHLRKTGFLVFKKDGDQLLVRLPEKRKPRKRFYAIRGSIRYEHEME